MADKSVRVMRDQISVPSGYKEKLLRKSAEIQIKHGEHVKYSQILAMLIDNFIDTISVEKNELIAVDKAGKEIAGTKRRIFRD